jgi:hypothetical protein
LNTVYLQVLDQEPELGKIRLTWHHTTIAGGESLSNLSSGIGTGCRKIPG